MTNHLTGDTDADDLEGAANPSPAYQGEKMNDNTAKKGTYRNRSAINQERAEALVKELRLLRARMGWTQSDLADMIETPFITISRWERGVNKPQSTHTLDILEKFLKKHRPK